MWGSRFSKTLRLPLSYAPASLLLMPLQGVRVGIDATLYPHTLKSNPYTSLHQYYILRHALTFTPRLHEIEVNAWTFWSPLQVCWEVPTLSLEVGAKITVNCGAAVALVDSAFRKNASGAVMKVVMQVVLMPRDEPWNFVPLLDLGARQEVVGGCLVNLWN